MRRVAFETLALSLVVLAGCALEDEPEPPSAPPEQPRRIVQVKATPKETVPRQPRLGEPGREQLTRIAAKRAEGRPSIAIKELQTFLQEHPDDDFAWVILGHCHGDLKQVDEAERCYKSAIEINDTLASAWTGLGIVQRKKKEYSSAIESYEKAIQRDSDSSDAHTSLSAVLMILGKNEEALIHAKKAFELSDDAAVVSNLAVAHHVNGEENWRDLYVSVLGIRREHRRVGKLKRIFSGELTVRDDEQE